MQVARSGTLPNSAPGSGQALGNPIGKANTRSNEVQLSSPGDFLAQAGLRTTTVVLREKQIGFSQGNPAEAVFYVQSGNIRLSVISPAGKEATIALFGAGDFLGEECMADPSARRTATAAAITLATLFGIEREEMVRALHEQNTLCDIFIDHLLARHSHVLEDLMDQLFNSSEKRLARILLLLARCGKHGVIPKVSQEILATMVGTTRARVNFFMNRFRKLGYVDFNIGSNGVLRVHDSLANVLYD
jgi:CRP/FNR family cyclic AMP-dependent transcriptional regulator